MIIDFIIEDLMLNSYLQKNFHTLLKTLQMQVQIYSQPVLTQEWPNMSVKNIMNI